MCLAVPAKIIKIENDIGTVDLDGVTRPVSLLLLEQAKVGDFVLVHAGFAIHKIDESRARESLEMLRASLALLDDGD